MTKYIITIAYDGSKYHGLQKLKNKATIQGELESVLAKLDHSPVKVTSSGRTDKGVHARNQVCTFELKKNIDPYRLRYYIDRETDRHLYIKTCNYLEDPNFHPRFSVKSKTYRYLINTGCYDPIIEDYTWNYNRPLDIEKMKKASKTLEGTHDYKAFVVGKHENTESTIFKIKITEQENTIKIDLSGIAFYTYMVRNIVSALVLVGSGKIDPSELEKMLTKKEKTFEYAPAPATGLYLMDIEY